MICSKSECLLDAPRIPEQYGSGWICVLVAGLRERRARAVSRSLSQAEPLRKAASAD
jgi:hypothetical protein